MAKPKVYVTRIIPQVALDMVSKVAEMEVWKEALPPPREVLMEKVKDIDGLLSLLTDKIDGPLMDAAPKLKVISNYAIGYDNVDIVEATKRGIVVGNTPGIATETTADFAFALLMAAARHVVEGDAASRGGKWKTWEPLGMLGPDVSRATLGIVGLGRIGKAMARRARGFDMKVLYNDIIDMDPKVIRELNVESVSLEKLLKESDFVSLHVPLTREGPAKTYHLIGEKELSLMKPTAILVNDSRGLVIDQKALYQALKLHRIYGAAIDVTEVEPISPDDPLLTLDNIIITPHIASASIVTRNNMGTMAADNLIAGLEGKVPPTCVNPEALKA